MDQLKKDQLQNVKVWMRRFGMTFDSVKASKAIDSANTHPYLKGSVRRLPIALIFNKIILGKDPAMAEEKRVFLSILAATAFVAVVYDGSGKSFAEELCQLVSKHYPESARGIIDTFGKLEIETNVLGAMRAREREQGGMGYQLNRALKDIHRDPGGKWD